MQRHHRHDYFAPDSFGRAVQDNLGDGLMLRLRQTLGGQDVRIPRADAMLLDDHFLVQAVGRADARRLCDLFDGERAYIRALGDREDYYMDALAEGLNNAEIAARIGVTVRQVRRYFAGRNIVNPNRRAHVYRARHADNATTAASISAE
jgi:FixJ family two-component response regulator